MIVILDYGVGNLSSISNMLKKSGVIPVITSNVLELKKASKIILPGMGHFDNCMRKLNASGLRDVLEEKVFEQKVPVLGICVGLQMFMEMSEEGEEPGLGWVKGKTIRFRAEQMNAPQKIPNMGWLEIKGLKQSQLLNNLTDARFYFAHSYHVSPKQNETELISAFYGYEFIAAVEQNNLLGVQFHPEKSHRFGMQLLKNFANNH